MLEFRLGDTLNGDFTVYASNVSGDSLSSLELTMPISSPIRQACRTWPSIHRRGQLTNTPGARLKLHPFRFAVDSLSFDLSCSFYRLESRQSCSLNTSHCRHFAISRQSDCRNSASQERSLARPFGCSIRRNHTHFVPSTGFPCESR